MTRIAIALFEGAEELDWAGPWEVLTMWGEVAAEDEVEVVTVADAVAPVRCAKGLRVLPDTTWERLGEVEVLVYPGGLGTRPQLGDETVRARLRRVHDRAEVVASVCTGALVFADAGLLDGRAATTHWVAVDHPVFAEHDVEIRPTERWIDHGDVLTAAGVSAGIDMALHLVRRLAGADTAREVRRHLQYDPAPPV